MNDEDRFNRKLDVYGKYPISDGNIWNFTTKGWVIKKSPIPKTVKIFDKDN